jgi:hypothetical protein
MKEFDKKKGEKLCSGACQYNSFIFGENILLLEGVAFRQKRCVKLFRF